VKHSLEAFVFRTYSRFPIRTPILYMGKDFAGQGAIQELSNVGCRILGSYPVFPGETVSLRISHPTHPDPLVIEQAEVRWVKGFEFGVSFGPLNQGAVDRLIRLLNEALDSRSYTELPAPS
jgi:hypothetical protein